MSSDSRKSGKESVSRRGFITGVAVGSVGAVVGREAVAQEMIDVGSFDDWLASQGGGGGSTDPLPADPTPPVDPTPLPGDPPTFPQSTVGVRRDIYTLVEGSREIQSLRRGIGVMQARDANNPLSWWYQAGIHAGVLGPNNRCQHNNKSFLSWHRMYLFFFEKILRAAAEDPDLTLPYWDYNVAGRGSLPVTFLPPGPPRQGDWRNFRSPPQTGQNPLYWQNRHPYYNWGGALLEDDVSVDAALRIQGFGETGFERFNGALEGGPHNAVHRRIGEGGGSMGNERDAGTDPIFWLHHCNVDRQWNRWLGLQGQRTNPRDPAFLGQSFEFHDETGRRVSMSNRDVMSTEFQLEYRYDDDPAPTPINVAMLSSVAPPPEVRVSSRPLARGRPVELGGGATRVALAQFSIPQRMRTITRRVIDRPETVLADGQVIPPTFRTVTETVVAAPEAAFVTDQSATNADSVVLVLANITFEDPAGVYGVFVNLPSGETPNRRGPYFAGNFAPFAQNQAGASEEYDISDLLNRQIEQGLFSEGSPIDVQFIATDPTGAVIDIIDDSVDIGSVTIERREVART